MNLDYTQLAALSAILRLGSFEAAAAHLGVTPSAISQRLKALEERVGTTLVQRGQPCTGTDAGRRLAAHADSVSLLETALARDLGHPEAGTTPARLRLAVNADSLATWFLPALSAQEDVVYDLVIDDQDHSADWLRRGEVVAAVTAHAKPVAGCDCSALGALPYTAAASPTFLDRWFPDGITAEALSRAPMLQFDQKDRLQQRWLQQVAGVASTPPTHLLPSSQGFVDAMLAGLGWGMAPMLQTAPHVATGRLVTLLPGQPLDVPLYWQISRIAAPALTDLTLAVRRQAKDHLSA